MAGIREAASSNWPSSYIILCYLTVWVPLLLFIQTPHVVGFSTTWYVTSCAQNKRDQFPHGSKTRWINCSAEMFQCNNLCSTRCNVGKYTHGFGGTNNGARSFHNSLQLRVRITDEKPRRDKRKHFSRIKCNSLIPLRGSAVPFYSVENSTGNEQFTGADDDEITEEEDKENEESFKAAVQEVQEAVQEVQESASKLTQAIVEKGPELTNGFMYKLFSRQFRSDVKRRSKWYISDWTDGFKNMSQVIPAILFLYCSCIAPAVSFGTIASELTYGSIGVVEFLLGCGLAGMTYSVLCGQPMAFVAPTGLTLSFIAGLFRFCHLKGVSFFPVYTWVGLWTSLFMIILGFAGSSRFIKLCTHFTDEVFNALLSVTFIYEAAHSLQRNFRLADPSNLTMPFVSLAMALNTYWATMKVNAISTSRYFNDKIRSAFKDFGPVTIIVALTLLNQQPWMKRINVPMLSVPEKFELAGGRTFLVPFMSVPVHIRMLCCLPAILLTSLFFMDQNISVRLVNKPDNKLKKGEAYNLDMIALGIITGGLSLIGLPWMCGATVQSSNHVRAMTKTTFNEESQEVEITGVTETRVTGYMVHVMIAASIYLLRFLKFLPIPVVSGVFLFLGRKLMSGNSFLGRIKDSIAESERLPEDHPINRIGRLKMNLFTGLQLVCLVGLWAFKECAATAIFFPSVIGILMLIRSFVLPSFFSEDELVALGDPTPAFK